MTSLVSAVTSLVILWSSAPVNLRVESMSESSVLLSWDPPQKGGCVLNYIIERRPMRSTGLVRKAWRRIVGDIHDTNYQLTGLTIGTSYLLRVAAVNEIGVGPFTELTNAVTTRLQYGT